MKRLRWFVLPALLIAAACSQPEEEKKITLQMTGPDWLPISLMEQISADFPAYAKEKLGYTVEINMDPAPWSTYYERLTAALAAGSPTYDLFVADSQWLGDFAESGHILKLNEHIANDPELAAIMDKIHPVLKGAYCAYPGGTENWWGFPQEADVQGFFVRKDLFTNADERSAFQSRYGHELPQTYEDWMKVEWEQARDYAEFFTRKAGETLAGETLENDFFGLALAYSKEYDFVSMAWLQFLYNWGGDVWDWETMQVDGHLNSPKAVESLEYFLDLMQFQPPGSVNNNLDGVNNAVASGLVAMASNWIAVSPGVIEDPSFSTVTDKIMVVVPPGANGRRSFNLGGQPFVVGSKSKHVKEALEYIKWWFQDAQQQRFAEGGGLPSTTALIESDEFKKSRAWTRAFADTIPYQRDVWKHPKFFSMITAQQEELHKAVSGEQTAQEALENAALRQEGILEEWRKDKGE
ncbi:MAG: extracellular solute-binding protein [Candidatus Poribacteria bacterium]|nr:extracellular solute-binding protein [Candidatus Poribacteria bacterium]